MQTIINLLSSVGQFFTTLGRSIVSLIDFVMSMISDLLYLVEMLVELLPALPAFFTWLPSAAVTTVILAFSILVTLRILGRSS